MCALLRKIAIVDDDEGVLKALARLVAAHGFFPQAYASPHAFLDSLSGTKPDCAVLDLQMPNMSGLELHYAIRRAGIKLPTIIITAHDEVGCREECQAAGVLAYLLKPFGRRALMDAIKSATEPNRDLGSSSSYTGFSCSTQDKMWITEPFQRLATSVAMRFARTFRLQLWPRNSW
jgi:FixJ family two-component response regulator